MKIAILGANGYIGHNLIEKLLSDTDHSIVALSPNAETIILNNPRFEKHNVDVFDTQKLHSYLDDCDAAYYLIHMMAQNKIDFAKSETTAALCFCVAAKGTPIKRVIYLGGLGSDDEKLSKHLSSRHKTGDVLRSKCSQVIEFRASMVIGHGSISYDILTNLVEKLPIITLPKMADTLTQPIGLDDAIMYLIAALDLPTKDHHIIEIGGPEQLSYSDLIDRYVAWRGKKMIIVKLHIIPISIVVWWLNNFTPKTEAKVGKIMIESLSNPMVVTNTLAKKLFPQVRPNKIEDVFV